MINKTVLHQIFQSYIDNFVYTNDTEHQEYYKWQVCNEFHNLMTKALDAPVDEFRELLYQAKKCSENIIDSYTQPFWGLVHFSESDKNPQKVQDMFRKLYVEDNGDLKVRQEKMKKFFDESNELLNNFAPGSFRYKQNSHSVSSYLFLNDPEHHYLFKASHCSAFANCIGFYEDWGTGDNIDLIKFHEMCDEVLEEIKNCPELLATNESRYDGRLKGIEGTLHPDENKHILLFDIIYCATTYEFYNGISFIKRNAKEKNLYLEFKRKAAEIESSFNKAKEDANLLEEALMYFSTRVKTGDEIIHKKLGKGKVEYIDTKYVEAVFADKKTKLGLATSLANGVIRFDIDDFNDRIAKYKRVLKDNDNISRMQDYYARQLEEYKDYL